MSTVEEAESELVWFPEDDGEESSPDSVGEALSLPDVVVVALFRPLDDDDNDDPLVDVADPEPEDPSLVRAAPDDDDAEGDGLEEEDDDDEERSLLSCRRTRTPSQAAGHGHATAGEPNTKNVQHSWINEEVFILVYSSPGGPVI